MSRLNLLHLGFASTPGHKPRPTAGRRAVRRTGPVHKLTKGPQIGVSGGPTVELPLPEHCCCYRSKPGCLWGNLGCSQHPKSKPGRKIKKCKKSTVGGPQLNYRCQSTAAAMEANPGGLGAFLAVLDGRNSNWAVKINFVKKVWDTPKLEFRGHFFTQKSLANA